MQETYYTRGIQVGGTEEAHLGERSNGENNGIQKTWGNRMGIH